MLASTFYISQYPINTSALLRRRSLHYYYTVYRGWYEELDHINTEALNREAEQSRSVYGLPPSNADNEQITQEQSTEEVIVKLRTLRRILFKEIIGYEDPNSILPIKITPKTLSEAIKALLDIDKRISEHAGGRQVTILEQYQRILTECAEIVEDAAE